jgi:hypothetical protein
VSRLSRASLGRQGDRARGHPRLGR